MRIGIFINTPAQAHFYKNIIYELKRENHEICVIIRENYSTKKLVQELQIPYNEYGHVPNSLIGKILKFPSQIFRSKKILKKFNPDLITGFGLYDAIVAKLLKTPCFIFTDTEPRISKIYSLYFKISMLLSDAVITPSFFKDNLGKKHIKIDSFKELSYLNQNVFQPNEDIFEKINLKKCDKFVILRLNDFNAVHDVGKQGFSIDNVNTLITKIEKYATVLIISERELPNELQEKIPNIENKDIHDLLYFSSLVVTDTQTIATESAILGTPAIRCNSFVGNNDHGNFIELEEKYDLIYNYRDPKNAIDKSIELLKIENLDDVWKKKKEHLLRTKVNMLKYMVDFITNYPVSLNEQLQKI